MQDEYSGYSAAMIDFMRRGNIRIVPEVNGINLSVTPNDVQKDLLRRYISLKRGEIELDIDDDKGNTLVSVEYPRGTSSTKILNDITEYFENGTEPIVSEYGKYRFQERDDEYMQAVENNDMETAQRMVDEAAKAAGYNTPMLYHGTQKFGFTEFDLNKMDDGISTFLTSTTETTSTYSGETDTRKKLAIMPPFPLCDLSLYMRLLKI